METELQMSRILKAMEMKANAKDDSSGGDAKPAADDGGDVDDVPNGDVPVEVSCILILCHIVDTFVV